MKIYQPFAIVENFLGQQASRFSRKVYPSHSQAMSAMPEFLNRLNKRDDYDLGYAEMVHRTSVIELELIEVSE